MFSLVLVILFFSSLLIINYSFPRTENNVSILVLGKGGLGHTAPDLTDTIMLVNMNLKNKKTNIISLPRDIWVSSIQAKLNTSYYWGKQKGGNGFDLASDSIKEVTGIKPGYVAVIDFSLFKDLIDTIGGIKINPDNTFIDEKYPIAGKEEDLCNGDKLYKCRYEILKIDKGEQLMDGEMALKFVRSRNAIGDEGTDLAREKRQQKVISAIKDKLLSKEVFLNFRILKSLYTVTISHIETNIDKNSIVAISRELFLSRNNINFVSIPDTMLMVSQGDKKYNLQYVFVPKSGTWKELQEWINQKN